ncbi:aldo/keto reductase [Tetragenococcus halophilus subsp. flandriensis]|uniref:aldo/keto reductase n=1 Tax=Tetragenococcus halophilus TaxID=51669 RepID=UPI0023E9184F|nr:aldo/keto reductase [Tetragenococcus halophilus]GMA08784.1 aldo/keto reductase [Tetragenococcus halophilus subsp. flandriensis]
MVERINITEDYSISRVLNGLWQLSTSHSLKQPLDMKDIKTAFYDLVEKGFTTFDLADIYTGAEEFLGSFIKELGAHSYLTADDIQIHTKYVPDKERLKDVQFEDTEYIIDRSLKRLNKDHIDIVQFHWWDYAIPRYIEVAEHLVKLKEKGKIRHIGVTNFDTYHLKELVDGGIPVVSCQSQYSLFDRRIEKQLLDYCQNEGISHFCYGTLAGGLLSEKYLNQSSIDPETRSQVKYLQIIEETLGFTNYQKLLVLLNDIAKEHRVSIANVATKYILNQPGVAATIIGIRNSQHVQSNEQIFDFDLTKDNIDAIQRFLSDFPILKGEPYELERTSDKFQSIIRMNENKE